MLVLTVGDEHVKRVERDDDAGPVEVSAAVGLLVLTHELGNHVNDVAEGGNASVHELVFRHVHADALQPADVKRVLRVQHQDEGSLLLGVLQRVAENERLTRAGRTGEAGDASLRNAAREAA